MFLISITGSNFLGKQPVVCEILPGACIYKNQYLFTYKCARDRVIRNWIGNWGGGGGTESLFRLSLKKTFPVFH